MAVTLPAVRSLILKLSSAPIAPADRRQNAQHLVPGGLGDLDRLGFEGRLVALHGVVDGQHG